MRKEAGFLEHIGKAAAVDGGEKPALTVGDRVAVEHDAALIGPEEAGDDVDKRGLAGAGAAEKSGHPALRAEGGVDREGAETKARFDLEPHAATVRRAAAEAMASESISAAIEMTTEITARRIAPASPPGTCVKV